MFQAVRLVCWPARVRARLHPASRRLRPIAAALLLWLCAIPYAAAQGFKSTGNLQVARAGQAAVLLKQGTVLLIGGYSGTTGLTSAEIYDPSSGAFTSTGSLSNAVQYPLAALLPAGKVLVLEAGMTVSKTEIYDPASGSFSAGPSLPAALDFPALVPLADGRLFVTGLAHKCNGAAAQCTSPVEIYDPATNQFTLNGQLQLARSSFTATPLQNGKVLIAGGFDANSMASTPSGSAEVYDPSSGVSTLATSQLPPTAAAGAVALADGNVLICGGGGLQYQQTCELYQAAFGQFSLTTGAMAITRVRPTMTLLPDGRVLVAGDINGQTPSAELYDPELGTFSPAGNFMTNRIEFSATSLPGGTVLLAGGEPPSTGPGAQGPALNSAEIYTPPALEPDFTLVASQSQVVVASGSTAQFDVLARASDGFTGSIALSCTQTGSASCTFDNGSITPGQTATVTLHGLNPGAGGVVRFDLVGASGSISHAVQLQVDLEPPVPALTPNSPLSFGDEAVGSTSDPQTVVLANSGESPLNISSISTEGDFTQTNNCPAGLANVGNPTCTITIKFAPTAQGNRSGMLVIADDAPFSPQTIQLSGIGTAPPGPAVTLAPGSLSFSGTDIGQPSPAQAIALTNTGTGSLTITAIAANGDFTATNTCGPTVAAGKGCAIAVTFKPTASGSRIGTLAVTDNAPGSPQTAALSGSGLDDPAPGITISPASLTFASETVGSTSSAQSVSVTNTGNADLTFTSIVASGDFAQSNTCGTSLAAGKSCVVSVTFMPSASGSRTGTLDFTDNAAGSPQTVGLSGVGTAASAATAAATLAPPSLSFASQAVGSTSTAQTVTITSSGAAALTIASIAITGDFAQANKCPAMLDANQNCTITVTFTPTASGSRTGTLSVNDNAGNSPQTVALTGSGASASAGGDQVTLQPASGGSASATVAAGQTATYNLALASAGSFAGAVTLNCSGAPAAATCTPTPTTATLDSTPVTLAVRVTTTAASALPPLPPGPAPPQPWRFLLLFSALLAALYLLAMQRRRRVRRAWLLGMLESGLLLALAGCGGSPAPTPTPVTTGTPAGTYTLTVTAASSGTPVGSTQLTLVVK